MPEPLAPQLTALLDRALKAFVRHARRPRVQGASDEHLRQWAAHYEAKAALREQNPVFAETLLPALRLAAPVVAGLPVFPAGVRVAVDEVQAGYVTVTVDVESGGGVLARVTSPTGANVVPTMASAATRLTIQFPAPVDGLYVVSLSALGAPLTGLYVPVCRTEYALFREDSRALSFAFQRTLPVPGLDYKERLALLIGADAAASTGQAALAKQLLAAARRLKPADSPTALFPSARG